MFRTFLTARLRPHFPHNHPIRSFDAHHPKHGNKIFCPCFLGNACIQSDPSKQNKKCQEPPRRKLHHQKRHKRQNGDFVNGFCNGFNVVMIHHKNHTLFLILCKQFFDWFCLEPLHKRPRPRKKVLPMAAVYHSQALLHGIFGHRKTWFGL